MLHGNITADIKAGSILFMGKYSLTLPVYGVATAACS
jgi:hypothetical protein